MPVDDKERRPIACVVCKIDIDGEPSDEDAASNSIINNAGDANAAETSYSNNISIDGEIINQNNNEPKIYTDYIGMLAVKNTHRRSGIGTALVQRAIHRMQTMGCQSIRLETEVANKGAMTLYENRLGFVREELLKKYYLNWGDAYRLRLWLNAV